MAENSHQNDEVGRKFDGSYIFTIGIVLGLILIVAGVGLIAYLGGIYSFIFGVPLLLIGLALPIFLQMVLAEKRR